LFIFNILNYTNCTNLQVLKKKLNFVRHKRTFFSWQNSCYIKMKIYRHFRLLFAQTMLLLSVVKTTDCQNQTLNKCENDQSTLCWPKCCYDNQAFNVDRKSCDRANKSVILQRPVISMMRYKKMKFLKCIKKTWRKP
jgi:hypothetical protein